MADDVVVRIELSADPNFQRIVKELRSQGESQESAERSAASMMGHPVAGGQTAGGKRPAPPDAFEKGALAGSENMKRERIERERNMDQDNRWRDRIERERLANIRKADATSQREATAAAKKATREREKIAASIPSGFSRGMAAGQRRLDEEQREREANIAGAGGGSGSGGVLASTARSAASSGAATLAQAVIPGRAGNVAASAASTAASRGVSALVRRGRSGAAAGASAVGRAMGFAGGTAVGAGAVAIGIAATAAAAALAALAVAATATFQAFREIQELGRVNAEIAMAQALSGLRTQLGRIRRGQLLGGSASEFITARSRFNEAMLDLGATILNRILPLLTRMLEIGESVLRIFEPIADFLLWIAGLTFEAFMAILDTNPLFVALKVILGPLKMALDAYLDAQEEARDQDIRDKWADIMRFLDPDRVLDPGFNVGAAGV